MSIESGDMTIKDRSVITGAFSLTLSVIIVKIIGFIYKVPLSYILDDEGMGYFNSAYTIFTFFYMLCTGGVPRAVSLIVTEARVKHGTYVAERAVSIALKLFALIGGALTLILAFFSAPLSAIISNKGAWFSIIAIAPSLLLVSVAGVLRGYLNGVGRLFPIAIYQVIEGVVKFVFGMLLALFGLRRGYDAPMISALAIFGITLGSLVGCIYLYIYQKTRISINKTKQKCDNTLKTKCVIEKIIRIAAPLTLGSVIMGLTNIIDLFLVMHSLTAIGYTEAEASALYGNYTTLAVPLLNLVISLITPLSVAALPLIAERYVAGDTVHLEEKSRLIISLCAFIAIPCALAFMVFPEEILALLFKSDSASVGAPLLALLAPSVIFLSLLTMMNTVLEATGHTKAPLISMSIGASVKLLMCYLLIENEGIGIRGAPIGTSACYGVSLIISTVLVLRLTNIRFRIFLSLYKPLVAAFISVFSARICYDFISNGIFTVHIFLLSVVIAIVLYIIITQILGNDSLKEIKKLSKHTKKA